MIVRTFLLALTATSTLVVPSYGSGDSLWAQELAYHMGVSSWVSQVKPQGSGLNLELCRVVDGKVVETLLGNFAVPFPDREDTRVAILASQTPEGTQLSLQVLDGLAVKHQAGFIVLETTVRLPPTLSEGDYVLGGDIDVEAISKDKRDISALKNGILLRVSQRPTALR